MRRRRGNRLSPPADFGISASEKHLDEPTHYACRPGIYFDFSVCACVYVIKVENVCFEQCASQFVVEYMARFGIALTQILQISEAAAEIAAAEPEHRIWEYALGRP